jgi:hypothetical protein
VVNGVTRSDVVVDVDDVLGLPAPRGASPSPSPGPRRKVVDVRTLLDTDAVLAAPVVEPDHSHVSRPKSGNAKGPDPTTLVKSGTTSFELELSELPTCWACTFVHRPDRGGLLALKFVNTSCEVHGYASDFKLIPWVSKNGSWPYGRAS